MKKMRKLFALVLALSMILSLTACSKKAISPDKFEDIMKKKFNYTVEEGDMSNYNFEDLDDFLVARGEDNISNFQYFLFKEADSAEDGFEDMVEQFEDLEEDDYFDGTIKKSGSDSFEKVVIQGDLFVREAYVVIIRSGKMCIMATYTYPDLEDKVVKKIDDIIKELGY